MGDRTKQTARTTSDDDQSGDEETNVTEPILTLMIAAAINAKSCFLTFGTQYNYDHVRLDVIRYSNCDACNAALSKLSIEVKSDRPDAGIWMKPSCSDAPPLINLW